MAQTLHRTDAMLKSAVVDELSWTPGLNSVGCRDQDRHQRRARHRTARAEGQHTSVTADAAGVVFLNGTVHSWSERREAEHATYSASGVTKVHNMLRVLN
jgi:hypothetical protein